MTPRVLVMSLLALSACAGAQTSSTSSTAPCARRAARSVIRDSHRSELYRAALAAAAKRGASEPIEIVVCGATVPAELSQALDVDAAVRAIARELWDEPLFRVRMVHVPASAEGRGVEACAAAASGHGFVPDVWVSASAEKDDPTERIRRTGNLTAGATLTVRVEAVSAKSSARAAPSASGPVRDALSVVVDAAREARSAILDEIAPELPTHSAPALGIAEPEADTTTAAPSPEELARR